MQRRRNIIDQGLSRLLLVIFILMIFFNRSGHAENMSQLYSYIANLGSVTQDASGAVKLPQMVYSGMSSGKVSPILQLTLTQHMMNSCAKGALKGTPGREDPYLKSAKAFEDSVCKLNKCFQTSMIVSMLPQLSGNTTYGGSSSASKKQGALQMMLSMMGSFKKAGGCGDQEGDGFDPMLLLLLTKAGGGGSGGALSGL